MNYFDLHCDTLTKAYLKKSDIFFDGFSAGINRFNDFESRKQCYAIWQDDELHGDEAFEYAKEIVDFFETQKKLLDVFDVSNIKAYLTVENAVSLGGKIENLRYFKDKGVIMLSLTWNGENEFAFGANCDENEPLKPKGKELLFQLEKENIVVDVSHLNRRGFFDVMNLASKAVVASHTCCCAVFDHERNLTDEQLKEIISCGGLIGICFYGVFLAAKENNTFERIYENIYHLCCLGGENNIAFGSDFDGAKMNPTISGVEKIPLLYNYLFEKGIKKDLLEKIFFKNSEKFFENILQ